MAIFTQWFSDAGAWLADSVLVDAAGPICTVLRFLFPVLALLIVTRCAKSLLSGHSEPETWAQLVLPDGSVLDVTHWENLIGRKRSCDLVVNAPTVSRTHAVLTRYDDGSWSIRDVGSKGGVVVNGRQTSACEVYYGDVIVLGGVELQLLPFSREEERLQAGTRTRAGETVRPGVTLLLLTIFQLLTALQLCLSCGEMPLILGAFGALVLLEWALLLFLKGLRRSGYEVETLAFWLTTIGMAICASDNSSELPKLIITVAIGLSVFMIIGWALRDLERAKKIRYIAAAGGIMLLALNLVFGTEINGARNWIYIGPVSFQPSELVKICFVFVGASTLERIVTRRNLFLFLCYTGVVCGALAIINDFGTALIFFAAFLVIAFLRSGNFATLLLICAGVAFAFGIAIRFRPYALQRFAAWGHVWQNALTSGYQQTRSMMCIAAGGLFGLGPGNGWLKYVAASDTDLVFAFVGEEWGLLIAVMTVFAVVCLGAFTVKSAFSGRSSFYTIGACAAMGILMVQTMLNVFGTVDFLPLTGVTFPFVSNGGSSMISSWGLLAFVKAADTRRNASFAVRLSGARRAFEEGGGTI